MANSIPLADPGRLSEAASGVRAAEHPGAIVEHGVVVLGRRSPSPSAGWLQINGVKVRDDRIRGHLSRSACDGYSHGRSAPARQPGRVGLAAALVHVQLRRRHRHPRLVIVVLVRQGLDRSTSSSAPPSVSVTVTQGGGRCRLAAHVRLLHLHRRPVLHHEHQNAARRPPVPVALRD